MCYAWDSGIQELSTGNRSVQGLQACGVWIGEEQSEQIGALVTGMFLSGCLFKMGGISENRRKTKKYLEMGYLLHVGSEENVS